MADPSDASNASIELGERIKAARESNPPIREGARKYSQQDLADAMGVSQGTIAGWELGYGELDVTVVGRIAMELGVSPGWLAYGEGNRDAQLRRAAQRLTERIPPAAERREQTIAAAAAAKKKGRRRRGKSA